MTLVVDVSSNNHGNNAPILFDVAYTLGDVRGAYVKATEGTTYVNPWRKLDAEGFARVGATVGYYHFARPFASDPITQARYFLDHLPPTAATLPMALDLEDGAKIGWGKLAAWAKGWLAEVESRGHPCAVYVNRHYHDSLPGCPWQRPLWLAAPGALPPPSCWLWQYGQTRVAGIPGTTDVNQWVDAPPIESKARHDVHLNSPIVGPPIFSLSGNGYWLVAADGGIFAFGDAEQFGGNDPLPAEHLNAPIVGAARSPAGHGLLLVAGDGGTFSFGDAPNYGSIPGL